LSEVPPPPTCHVSDVLCHVSRVVPSQSFPVIRSESVVPSQSFRVSRSESVVPRQSFRVSRFESIVPSQSFRVSRSESVNTGRVTCVSEARQSLKREFIAGDVAKGLRHRVFPGGHPSKY
jgi:hypothetical protein